MDQSHNYKAYKKVSLLSTLMKSHRPTSILIFSVVIFCMVFWRAALTKSPAVSFMYWSMRVVASEVLRNSVAAFSAIQKDRQLLAMAGSPLFSMHIIILWCIIYTSTCIFVHIYYKYTWCKYMYICIVVRVLQFVLGRYAKYPPALLCQKLAGLDQSWHSAPCPSLWQALSDWVVTQTNSIKLRWKWKRFNAHIGESLIVHQTLQSEIFYKFSR